MCMVPVLVAAELGAAPTPSPDTLPRPPLHPSALDPLPGGAPSPETLPLHLDLDALSLRQREDILFDTCSGCLRAQVDAMSAIPQGVLAAKSVAANRAKQAEAARSDTAFEHPPLKYNSKLMNSIWGLYNRYSVHNFKKNTDGEAADFNIGSQQPGLMTRAAVPLSGALLDSFCLQ